MTEKGILKVFISSTYRDLKELGELLIEGIDISLEAASIEKFGPSDTETHYELVKNLENSDICIFIIGDCYGTLIEDCKIRTDACGDCKGNISFTHCEYRRALQAGKPHIVYVLRDEISEIFSHMQKFDLNIKKEDYYKIFDTIMNLKFRHSGNTFLNCMKRERFNFHILQGGEKS
jgi:hypothetical protein